MNKQLTVLIVEDVDSFFHAMQTDVKNIANAFTVPLQIKRFGESFIQRGAEQLLSADEPHLHPKFIVARLLTAIEQAQERGEAVLVIIDLLICGSNGKHMIDAAINQQIWSVAPQSRIGSVPIIIYTAFPEYIKAIKRPNRVIISKVNPGSYEAPDLLYQAMEELIMHLVRGEPHT